MSTTFSETATFRLSPPAAPGVPLHQSNSWCALSVSRSASRSAPWHLIRCWAERRGQRRALAELARMSHLLDDIGLTRAQALREAAKPFWQR
jgi:uncharacterized protein YjiS (DUF1127 family)